MKKEYLIHYTIAGSVTVEADSLEEAENMSADITNAEFVGNAIINLEMGSGLEVGTIEEIEED